MIWPVDLVMQSKKNLDMNLLSTPDRSDIELFCIIFVSFNWPCSRYNVTLLVLITEWKWDRNSYNCIIQHINDTDWIGDTRGKDPFRANWIPVVSANDYVCSTNEEVKHFTLILWSVFLRNRSDWCPRWFMRQCFINMSEILGYCNAVDYIWNPDISFVVMAPLRQRVNYVTNYKARESSINLFDG